jgi:hypothetical protein
MANLISKLKTSNEIYGIYRDPQAIGSEQVYILNKVLGQSYAYTEGVRHLFLTKESYWIRDLIFSYANKITSLNEDFISVNIFKDSINDNSGYFLLTDGNDNVLLYQFIEFIDIENNIELYLEGNSERRILMLPSER